MHTQKLEQQKNSEFVFFSVVPLFTGEEVLSTSLASVCPRRISYFKSAKTLYF